MLISEYLKVVEEQIRQKKIAPELLDELRQHIEAQACAYEEDGLDRNSAVQKAVEEMGDPVHTGVQLDMVHQPQMDKKLLFIILAAFIFTTGVTFISMSGDFDERHTLWPGLCLVILFICSLSPYRGEYEKSPFSTWCIYEIAAISCTIAIPDIFMGQAFFSSSLIGFAAISFRYRNGGQREFFKLVAFGIASCITSLILRSFTYTYLFLLAHAVIITVAALCSWYKIPVRKYLLALWSVPGVFFTIFLGFAFLNRHNLEWSTNYTSYLNHAETLANLFHTDSQIGILAVVLCLLLLILLLACMMLDIHRLTNQFCRISCIGILAGFFVTYLHSFLCLLGFGSADMIHFPFFTLDGSTIRSDIYFYFMLAANFLQLYRQDRVIPRRKPETL